MAFAFSAFRCFSTSYTSAAYVANPNVLVRVNSVTSTSGTYATIRSVRKTAASMADDDHPNHGSASGGVAINKGSSHVSPYATSYVATAAGSNNYHVYSKPASPTASKISYYACTPLVSMSSRPWKTSETVVIIISQNTLQRYNIDIKLHNNIFRSVGRRYSCVPVR